MRKTIQLDREMIAEYEMMQTEAFEAMAPERQIAAFMQWLESVRNLTDAVRLLRPHLDQLLDSRSDDEKVRDALVKRMRT